MSASNGCANSEMTCAYVAHALDASERAAARSHIADCQECRREVAVLDPIVARLFSWPVDILRPRTSLQEELALRIAADTGKSPVMPPSKSERGVEWTKVAPGIECQVLSHDQDKRRVTMLVRLAPQGVYPAHRHADVEELHVLDGELRIDDKTLAAGDFNYGAPGVVDQHVWSATGCTCLLITSLNDTLR